MTLFVVFLMLLNLTVYKYVSLADGDERRHSILTVVLTHAVNHQSGKLHVSTFAPSAINQMATNSD